MSCLKKAKAVSLNCLPISRKSIGSVCVSWYRLLFYHALLAAPKQLCFPSEWIGVTDGLIQSLCSILTRQARPYCCKGFIPTGLASRKAKNGIEVTRTSSRRSLPWSCSLEEVREQSACKEHGLWQLRDVRGRSGV